MARHRSILHGGPDDPDPEHPIRELTVLTMKTEPWEEVLEIFESEEDAMRRQEVIVKRFFNQIVDWIEKRRNEEYDDTMTEETAAWLTEGLNRAREQLDAGDVGDAGETLSEYVLEIYGDTYLDLLLSELPVYEQELGPMQPFNVAFPEQQQRRQVLRQRREESLRREVARETAAQQESIERRIFRGEGEEA